MPRTLIADDIQSLIVNNRQLDLGTDKPEMKYGDNNVDSEASADGRTYFTQKATTSGIEAMIIATLGDVEFLRPFAGKIVRAAVITSEGRTYSLGEAVFSFENGGEEDGKSMVKIKLMGLNSLVIADG